MWVFKSGESFIFVPTNCESVNAETLMDESENGDAEMSRTAFAICNYREPFYNGHVQYISLLLLESCRPIGQFLKLISPSQ